MSSPKKISVYCVEVEGTPKGDVVVLNTDRGFLRAALITTNHKEFVRWLGGECVGDVAPRRHAQNFASEVLGYWK